MILASIVEGIEWEACIERNFLTKFLHDIARQYVLEIVSPNVHITKIVRAQSQRGVFAIGIE